MTDPLMISPQDETLADERGTDWFAGEVDCDGNQIDVGESLREALRIARIVEKGIEDLQCRRAASESCGALIEHLEAALRSSPPTQRGETVADEAGNWLEPYRSRDASGSPESAGQVGWDWLGDLARQERAKDAVLLEIQTSPLDADGKAGTLYRSTKPVAAYFVVRDPMNFAVLYRWRALSTQRGDRNAVLEATVARLGAALTGCVEHLEWSTPQGGQAYVEAQDALAALKTDSGDAPQ